MIIEINNKEQLEAYRRAEKLRIAARRRLRPTISPLTLERPHARRVVDQTTAKRVEVASQKTVTAHSKKDDGAILYVLGFAGLSIAIAGALVVSALRSVDEPPQVLGIQVSITPISPYQERSWVDDVLDGNFISVPSSNTP